MVHLETMSPLDAFMRDYWNATTANPFARHERVWEMRAAFEVTVFNQRIRLGCVRSFTRQQGDGSAALDWLCALADRHAVKIEGSVKPVGQTRPRLNAQQLRRWYKAHGFSVDKRGDISRVPTKPEKV